MLFCPLQKVLFGARGIVKSFKKRKKVLCGVDVVFDKDDITGIFGSNGAGKTTLFSILIGDSYPDDGEVYLDGIDITDEPMYRRARLGLIYLPQESSIFKDLSVEDNIKAVLELRHKDGCEIQYMLEHLLESFAIAHIRKSKGSVLSGGERRKVEIARSLAADPLFLLLDEPFYGIDPISISEISNIIMKLKKDGVGIIITDHNVRDTLSILDKGYVIVDGKVLFSGTPDEIRNDESCKSMYLGKMFT
jgi:lipopolysaccharide export system ATP-binding protein